MVYLIGVSCLDKAYNSTSYSFKRTGIKFTHIPGLRFCHKIRLKSLIRFLTCGSLKTRSNIMIWPDIINNTTTTHPSNDNITWSTKQLISTLATYKDRLAVIIYCKRFGTPDIFERLLTSRIFVISLHKHLLSYRKRNNDWYLKEIEEIHPSVQLETGFLFTILNTANIFVDSFFKNDQRQGNASQTRRERLKSAQYPRLKKRKTFQICPGCIHESSENSFETPKVCLSCSI